MNSIFLNEAIAIGNRILDVAVHQNDKQFWIMRKHSGELENTPSLYSGDSGVLFYLIELYKVTEHKEYLDAIQRGCAWLISNNDKYINHNLAWYGGIGGIVYCLLETYKITQNEYYRENALLIAKSSNTIATKNCDILHGSAGQILTLLQLYNETHEDWVANAIIENINVLFNNMIFPANGVCWGMSSQAIRPLCGFAHGASGIAYVFLELYKYFNNEIFYKVALMAFDYEDQYLTNGNWPDFRKDAYDDDGIQKFVNAYRSGESKLFFEPSFMSAWCHGAPGIGLARLHAHKVNSSYELSTSLSAIQNTKLTLKASGRNFTLCHGILGNATLFIKAFEVLNDNKYINYATNAAELCLHDKKKYGYWVSGLAKNGEEADCGLLNGLSGIGIFMLQIASHQSIPSPLCPIISKSIPAKINLNQFNIAFHNEKLCENYLPNTYSIIGTKLVDSCKSELTLSTLLSTISSSTSGLQPDVEDALRIDIEKIKLSDSPYNSGIFLATQSRIYTDQFLSKEYSKMGLEELFNLQLQLDWKVKLLETKNHYNIYTVLQMSTTGINQFSVNNYIFDLLRGFQIRKITKIVYNDMKCKHYVNTSNINEFNKIFITQVLNCIMMQFFVIHKD